MRVHGQENSPDPAPGSRPKKVFFFRTQPADRVRLERVLRYIFRPSLPLKNLSYVEATGEVRYDRGFSGIF